jgi:hypothetical protein
MIYINKCGKFLHLVFPMYISDLHCVLYMFSLNRFTFFLYQLVQKECMHHMGGVACKLLVANVVATINIVFSLLINLGC